MEKEDKTIEKYRDMIRLNNQMYVVSVEHAIATKDPFMRFNTNNNVIP